MSEDSTSIARDATRIHQSLKELLDTNGPYDKEVEFQRKKLRRQYLQLLLIHPLAPESKDVETHLWMQTSYSFITAYKRRVNDQDPQQLQQQQQQQQQQQSQAPQQQRHVEYRKLLQRFRQFLAEEEKFWAKLLGRLHYTFVLDKASKAPKAVGIPFEEEQLSVGQAGAGGAGHGRAQQQFPPVESTPPIESKTPAEKEALLATFSKALVCLGDVARYRELYNESGGRPKAGQDDGAPARKRNRKAPQWVENMSKARNYDKARECYEQAKFLVPHEGKPSQQLAILASYKRDHYTSLMHYYRALCVKQPCDTALSNMRTLLLKSLEEWRVATGRDKDRSAPLNPEMHPGMRVDKFKNRVVALHGLWRFGLENGVDKMNSIARRLDNGVFRDFAALVAQRQMPVEMITQAIVMSQGALWKHQMLRDASSQQIESPALLEWSIVKHVLDMYSALLEVGRDELGHPTPHDIKDDLAQQITATFRRTLPALRVASKWLRANVKYLSQDPEFNAYREKRKGIHTPKPPNKISCYSTRTKHFWECYAEFARTLARNFPLAKLPKLIGPLEEDSDLRGFLPLKNLMSDSPTDREEVHPNVDQLMRIADLLEDARVMAEFEFVPIQYYSKSGIVMLNPAAFEAEPPKAKIESVHVEEVADTGISWSPPEPPVQDVKLNAEEKEYEDSMSDMSPDDDEDVVRDAFSHLDARNQDDDDDEIVFDPKPSMSPVRTAASPATTSPISPPRPHASMTTMSGPTAQSPIRSNGASPRTVASTTAEDLLIGVMGLPPLSLSAAPQPPLTFGPNLTHRSSQSIWSTSHDEQRMMTGTTQLGGSPLFRSPTLQYSSLVAPTQTELPSLTQKSIWGAPAPLLHPSGGFENIQHQGDVISGSLGLGSQGPTPQRYAQAALPTSSGISARQNNLLQHHRTSSFIPQLQNQQQPQYHASPSVPLSTASHRSTTSTTVNPPNGLPIDRIGNPNFTGTLGGSHDSFYNSTYQVPYHTRHLSYNDSKLGSGMPQQPPPPVWGST